MMAEPLDRTAHRRILSIDGGGIKGACPAAFLAGLEEELPNPIGSYFDLISGTSVGGILAIGLALGISAKELLEFCEQQGPEIFGQSGHPNRIAALLSDQWASLKHWITSKHDADTLRAVLSNFLQAKCIGDAKTRLIVPAWDADLRSVYLYKTAHHPRFVKDHKKPAIDAALATAAAPSFYRRYRTVEQVGLIDGGVWANNPTGIAAVEAATVLGWNSADLKILSLGCIDETYSLPDNPGKLGLGWKGRVLSLFLDGQSSSAMGIAKLITGDPHERKAIYRYEARAPQGLFRLDDTTKISQLKGLGHSMARRAHPELAPIFFEHTAAPFEPFHTMEEAA